MRYRAARLEYVDLGLIGVFAAADFVARVVVGNVNVIVT
jgi:hypothetical protein